MITIERYRGGRDDEVAALILGIQNEEAGLNLTVADQPDLLDIADSYQCGGFWVALHDGAIIGTIGLMVYGRTGVLKKLFVAASFRGENGPAAGLFRLLLDQARALGIVDLVLDTPSVATRSHAFYEKSGFRKISADKLPKNYLFANRNSLLFGLSLTPDAVGAGDTFRSTGGRN